MQKKEWRRNLLVGVIVAAIFFGWWLRGFLYTNWRFRLFSGRSWSFVIHELESGWALTAKSDWIFLITLLFSVPTFLYLWYLCAKIRWRALIKKIWKGIVAFWDKLFNKKSSTKKQTKTLAPPPPPGVSLRSSSSNRPRPVEYSMPISGGRVEPMTSTSYGAKPIFSGNSGSIGGASVTAPASGWAGERDDETVYNSDLANVPLEDIQMPQREPVPEDVPGLFRNAGYQLIENVKTSLQKLDFLAVGAGGMYAVLFDRESGDWLAEEEPFNGEAPLWFSEVDHRVSPVYELKQGIQELQEKVSKVLPDFVVRGFMVEEKGNIINTEEMLKIWKELDVVVSRTDIGGSEDLPVTEQAIKNTTPASAAQMETLIQLFKGEK